MDFEQVLKEVVWRLVTEGRISHRHIKLTFALDDDGLEELRSELIGIKRVAADVDGERLVLASEGRLARPEGTALSQPLPALRLAESLFHIRRDQVTAAEHRASRTQKFKIWAEICSVGWQ